MLRAADVEGAGHAVCLVLPEGQKNPEEQPVHAEPPVAEKEPAAHGVQLASVTDVTLPAVPGGQ